MTTVNILSATTYHKFIEDVIALRKKYITNHIEEGNRLPMMTNYLRYPHMLAICNLNKDAKDKVLEHKDAIDRHLASAGIPVSYTNVFWGGRSEIKPSEISPKVYREWHEKYAE